MTYFRQHISQKPVKTSLSIVDLLHVSNFKGGNASITEPISHLDEKLKFYEGCLNSIEQIFGQKNMGLLDQQGVDRLIELCDGFLTLTKSTKSNIRGFGPSYASALLAAHYPDLIPILDRRVLNGAGIQRKLNSDKQVKNIEQYYGELIRACWAQLRTHAGMSLRELDKQWFVKAIEE